MFHKIWKGKTNKIFTDTFSDIHQSSAVWHGRGRALRLQTFVMRCYLLWEESVNLSEELAPFLFRVANLDVPHFLQHRETATWTLPNVLKGVITVYLLGAFANHVCLSVCPHGTTRLPLVRYFMKFDILKIFRKSAEKLKILLKSDKKIECFTRIHVFDHIVLDYS